MTSPLQTPPVDPDPRLSVLWVTNLAAPYRIPVWRYLTRHRKLTVALLESNAGLQRDAAANRGLDWLHLSSGELKFTELPTWTFRRGESRLYALKSIRSVTLVRKFDVVLFGGWESPAYWVLLLACFIFRVARVGFYESTSNTMTHKTGVIAALRSAFFRSMNNVVVPGTAANQAVLALGVHKDRISQGFNAVDVTEFHRVATASTGTGSELLSRGHKYLYVGQLIARKRVNAIINAFLQIADADDELTIVGTGQLRHELSIMVKDSKTRVRFLGHVENDQMPMLMAEHHTLVLASEREVWGLVVNEALASGMHVVVSDNCGVSPSVQGMQGVYLTDHRLVTLADRLVMSRAHWSGRIVAPEILQHTPERFGEVFDQAFVASLTTKTLDSAKNGGQDDVRV